MSWPHKCLQFLCDLAIVFPVCHLYARSLEYVRNLSVNFGLCEVTGVREERCAASTFDAQCIVTSSSALAAAVITDVNTYVGLVMAGFTLLLQPQNNRLHSDVDVVVVRSCRFLQISFI